MSHAVPFKKRRQYEWKLVARNKRGTVLFSHTETCADPVLAHISILQLIKVNATHKWAQIDTRIEMLEDGVPQQIPGTGA